VDFNAGAGESAAEKRRLAPLVQDALRKGFGAQFLAPGHFNHAHVDVGRYRAVGNMRPYFDKGGLARGKGWMPKNVLAPERTLDPRQTVAFERLVDVLDRPATTPVPVVQSQQLPPIYVQSPVTGEYLLARMDERADGRIAVADQANATALTYGLGV
jgi:hypothetical protein